MNLSKHESKRGGWHTAWSAGQESEAGLSHHRAPENPDPLGSYEADWEYQGRYLELERQLLEDVKRSGGGASYRQTASSRGGTPSKRGGARSDAGRGSDYETYEGFRLQREGHGHATEIIVEKEGQEPGLEIRGAQRGGRNDWQDCADYHPGHSGQQRSQPVAARVLFCGDQERERGAGILKRRSRPTSKKSGRGQGKRQGRALKTKGKL
jgi:hypothetical protein